MTLVTGPTMPTIPTMLEAARALRDLMATQWTHHAYARNAANERVDADSPDAVSFCLLGGCEHLVHKGYPDLFYKVLNAADVLYPEMSGAGMTNDVLGQQAVLALCDHVIARMEAEAAS